MTNHHTQRLRKSYIALACATILLAGCTASTDTNSSAQMLERAYVVTVFLETNTQTDHSYSISVVQQGAVLAETTQSAMANFPFRFIVFSPSVQPGDAVVRIEENGGQLASSVVSPQACPSGEVAATIMATDQGATIEAACS